MAIGSICRGIQSKGYPHLESKAEAPEALAAIANAPQFPIDNTVEWGRPEKSADLGLSCAKNSQGRLAARYRVCQFAAGGGGRPTTIGGLSIPYATMTITKRIGITIGGTRYFMGLTSPVALAFCAIPS